MRWSFLMCLFAVCIARAQTTRPAERPVIEVSDDRGLVKALNECGPRTIRLPVGGTIRVDAEVIITGEEDSGVILDGQGATIEGRGLMVRDGVSDVAIRNLKVVPDAGQHDGITVWGSRAPVERIRVEGCTFERAGDEAADVWSGCRAVTFYRCAFLDGRRVGHPKGPHSCGALVGESDDVTFQECLFFRNDSRNPLIAGGYVHLVNCVMVDGYTAIEIARGESGRSPRVNIVGCVTLGAPSVSGRPPIAVHGRLDPGSLYVSDNRFVATVGLPAGDVTTRKPVPVSWYRDEPWPGMPAAKPSAETVRFVARFAGVKD